jgi:hypothetical protein
MKKIVLILSSIFLIIASLGAQETSFGIKAGLNMATVDIDDQADYDSKAGAHVGVLAHIHISDHFAIQPEVVYSMQGGKGVDHKLQANYINIPLLAQYMFNNGFRLQTGPQLGVLISAERKSDALDVDVKDRLKTVDFAWSIGAGYLFPAGLGIDGRFNWGLSNINEPSEGVEATNKVFQIGLFYQFPHRSRTTRTTTTSN